jgi:Icc-related predicted phosphoesterase
MIIDCISDLHGYYPELEGGDLLIVAGDLTGNDSADQLWNFSQWMINQDYKYKIVIAGNHDNTFYENYYKKNEKSFVPFLYLCDSGIELDGLKIWGSPWTLTFEGMNPHCKAFTVDTEEELEQKWKNIPYDIDILITHSPPWGILDAVRANPELPLRSCGSLHLYLLLKYAIRPRLHVFGHIHEGYGRLEQFTNCISVNASHVNGKYEPVNKPIRIEL